jgi:hypothetical protein
VDCFEVQRKSLNALPVRGGDILVVLIDTQNQRSIAV